MSIDFLIPWRDMGCLARKQSLNILTEYLTPYGNVILGDSNPDQPFNVSEARNNAAAETSSDVLVFLDADAWVPIGQLQSAVHVAGKQSRLVKPFTWAGYLTREHTERMWNTRVVPEFPSWINPPARGFCGLAWVLQRDLYMQVGGFDTAFKGYGGEDNAFQEACELVAGTKILTPGWAYSLWHPAERWTSWDNLQRLQAYRNINSVEEFHQFKEGTL